MYKTLYSIFFTSLTSIQGPVTVQINGSTVNGHFTVFSLFFSVLVVLRHLVKDLDNNRT